MGTTTLRRLCLAGFAFAALAQSAHALDVELITATAGPARENGIFTDYFMSFTVEGSEIAGGTVFRPGLPPTPVCDLVFAGPGFLADEHWSCEREELASLNDICQQIGFGDFLIEVLAANGPDDTVTIAFDPGCSDPFDGHPMITAPSLGAVVPPLPGSSDFCWTCVSGSCGPGDYAAAIADDVTGDLGNELIRNAAVPGCWEPGICLPIGFTYEFSVTAVEIVDDLTEDLTDAGDPFLFLSAFESFDFTTFSVTSAPSSTPPAVPDGSGVTEAMTVLKGTADGSSLNVSWDVGSCCDAAGDHHLIWGFGASLPVAPGGTYAPDGSECDIGTTGGFAWAGVPDPGPGPGEFLWWLILADDDSSTEGAWGTDGSGLDRNGPGPAGVSSECGMTSRDQSNACGR